MCNEVLFPFGRRHGPRAPQSLNTLYPVLGFLAHHQALHIGIVVADFFVHQIQYTLAAGQTISGLGAGESERTYR